MNTIWLLLAVVNANAWLFPNPADKFGWGLRIQPRLLGNPFLAREDIGRGGYVVALTNQSDAKREFTPFDVALRSRDLVVIIVQPDGTSERLLGPLYKAKLISDKSSLGSWLTKSAKFDFDQLGLDFLSTPGVHELRASLQTDQGLVIAPAFKLKVIEPTADAILHSQPIPLEGQQAKWSKDRQERAVIQHIKIGNRTWLFYRKYFGSESGGAVYASFRIAELPGKVVDFKVEGAFGGHNPLTITYREHTYTKWTTTHVINSVDGRPWTAAEEKQRQEELKLEAKLPTDKN